MGVSWGLGLIQPSSISETRPDRYPKSSKLISQRPQINILKKQDHYPQKTRSISKKFRPISRKPHINIRNTPRSISKKLQTNIPKAPDQYPKSPGPLPKKPQIHIQKCVTRHSRENRREGRVGIGIGSRANRIRSFFIETCFL